MISEILFLGAHLVQQLLSKEMKSEIEFQILDETVDNDLGKGMNPSLFSLAISKS